MQCAESHVYLLTRVNFVPEHRPLTHLADATPAECYKLYYSAQAGQGTRAVAGQRRAEAAVHEELAQGEASPYAVPGAELAQSVLPVLPPSEFQKGYGQAIRRRPSPGCGQSS